GHFEIDGLVPGAYTLVARTALATAGPVTAQLTERSGPVTLRLAAAAALEVTVTSATERALVGNATVEVRGLDLRTARTDAHGAARIAAVAPGVHEVAAW